MAFTIGAVGYVRGGCGEGREPAWSGEIMEACR